MFLTNMEKMKHYLSICNSSPSEFLAVVALKSSKKILILDLSKLDFRRVEFKKKINCICKK